MDDYEEITVTKYEMIMSEIIDVNGISRLCSILETKGFPVIGTLVKFPDLDRLEFVETLSNIQGDYIVRFKRKV